MRGVSLTAKTSDLSYIFFSIRAARSSNVRRSWLRRARIALESRTDLTPAERHEIIVVRSQSNVSRIASPAVEEFDGTASAAFCDWQKQPARQYMRAGFDQHGQPTRKKAANKKAATVKTIAANDDCFMQVFTHPYSMPSKPDNRIKSTPKRPHYNPSNTFLSRHVDRFMRSPVLLLTRPICRRF